MPRGLVSLALLAALAGPALARDLAADLAACRQQTRDAARLACYDRLALPGSVQEFSGSGSAITPQFSIAGPSRLEFESRDAVMVIYLLDAGGQVVQNLHRGGAGGGSFLIRQPGRYSLQVNATGSWRIGIGQP